MSELSFFIFKHKAYSTSFKVFRIKDTIYQQKLRGKFYFFLEKKIYFFRKKNLLFLEKKI